MICDICVHADEHGSWPSAVANKSATHCRSCHRTWTAKREAHCAACCEHFTSDNLAEKHRRGYECMTVAEMKQERNQAGEPIFRYETAWHGDMWRFPQTMRLKPDWS